MRVTEGIQWIGICTENFDETVSFFSKTMGMKVLREGVPVIDVQYGRYCVLDSKSDIMLEVLEPKEKTKGRFNGPVVSFTVENLEQSKLEMENEVEFISSIITDNKAWKWIYFRGPDGNVYQIQERIN